MQSNEYLDADMRFGLPTRYNGQRFRSKTEARWAIFFDILNVPYAYEPEPYHLGDHFYLPDFYLLEQRCWIEIKGAEPTAVEREKAAALCAVRHEPVFIFAGAPHAAGFPVAAYTWDAAPALKHRGQVREITAFHYQWQMLPGVDRSTAALREQVVLQPCLPTVDTAIITSARLRVAYKAAEKARVERQPDGHWELIVYPELTFPVPLQPAARTTPVLPPSDEVDILYQFIDALDTGDEPMLAQLVAEVQTRVETILRLGRTDAQAAMLCFELGRYLTDEFEHHRARPYLEHAATIHEVGDRLDAVEHALAWEVLGRARWCDGDTPGARTAFQRSLDIQRERFSEGVPRAIEPVFCLGMLAALEELEHNLDRAVHYCQAIRALPLPHARGGRWMQATALRSLVEYLYAQGDVDQARQVAEQALALIPHLLEMNETYPQTIMTWLGILLLHQKDLLGAMHYLDQAIDRQRHAFDDADMPVALLARALVCFETGDPDDAWDAVVEAEGLLHGCDWLEEDVRMIYLRQRLKPFTAEAV